MSHRSIHTKSEKGFSLVELMVGVVIGLVGVLAMFQVLALWDKMKRSTSSGSDAQIAGTVGFYRLERDIKQGGMGFGAAQPTVMGCNVAAVVNATATTTARGAFTFPLVPVRIEQGASDAPDRITVLYGNSSFFAAEQPFTTSTSVTKKTKSRHGFKIGDAVVVADELSHCVLMEVTNDTNADLLTLDHTAGALRYNRTTGSDLSAPAPFSFGSGVLFNLGPRPQLNVWEISNASLVVTDGLATNTAATVSDGIIDLQAQYGIDSNGDYKVDTWQETAPTDWTRLLAVRVAMLARSQQYEPTRTEGGTPVYVTPDSRKPILPWEDAGGNPIYFAMKNVNGSADSNSKDDTDWRNYRYRVYAGVIPLRNIVWGVSP